MAENDDLLPIQIIVTDEPPHATVYCRLCWQRLVTRMIPVATLGKLSAGEIGTEAEQAAGADWLVIALHLQSHHPGC
jgi:hypothetical protein